MTMNAGESTEDIPTEDALTRWHWRVDGLMHRIVIKSQEAIAAVRDAAMKAMTGPGPDDFVREDDERVMVPVRVLEQMARRFGNNQGPGSVSGNSRALTILVALNTALLIGVGGWLLATVARHDKEIAVLECQMSPECSQAVRRGNP